MRSRRWIFIYILVSPVFCWGQRLQSPPLPYKVCQFERIHVAETDSVRRQMVTDSLARLLPGRWQLVEMDAGDCFVAAHAPDRYTEMVLTDQGKGTVHQGGKLLTTFQLSHHFYWGQLRFIMEETRDPAYFDFFPSSVDKRAGRYYKPDSPYEHVYKNTILVCKETLVMYGPRTGLSFVFKRLPSP